MKSENVLLILLMVSHMLCVHYRYFVNIFSQCVNVLEMAFSAEETYEYEDNNNTSEVLWKSLTFIFHTM